MPTGAVDLVLESFASAAALRHPWAWVHWWAITNGICPQLTYDGEDMRYYPHSGTMVHQMLVWVGRDASKLVEVTGDEEGWKLSG